MRIAEFFVGRVIDLPENGDLSLKFLDRYLRDNSVYKSDNEQVERQYIFKRQ